MSSNAFATRLVHGLLTAGLMALVVGTPFICFTSDGHAANFLASEGKDTADDDSAERGTELSTLFAIASDCEFLTPSAIAYFIADERVEMQAAPSGTHLLRGPPGC